MHARLPLRFAAIALGAVTTVTVPALIAFAEIPQITLRQRAEKKSFTDDEILEGFFRTAFGAEYHLAGRIDRIRKYEGPVRVFVDGARFTKRSGQLAKIIEDIGKRVQHLDIAHVDKREGANVVVTLVRDGELHKTIAKLYGADKAREIQNSLDPQCLSGFSKDEKFQIQRSEVLLTVDNGDFVFHDCAYEEVLQSLGPINDTDKVPWTMFNDDVSMGFFSVYDQYLMNILYDPRIKAGMTVQDVKAVLPDVLTDVRIFVAKTNNLVP